jgi:phospholipase D1/2
MPGDRQSIVEPILAEKRNCWKVVRAERAALIIDAERYFRVLRESLLEARASVFIIGWDIHSELRLVRDEEDDGFPTTLGMLLDEIAERRPALRIHILSWDFSMIYAMEREFFPTYKLRWKSHDRVLFCLDGEHPVGASQHQKLVVVDDRIAFCGGIDLSQWRWDTSAHRIDDHRRVDPDGKPYPPFHDMQMAVEGEAACALGALARHRWRAAAGEEPEGGPDRAHSTLWPPSLEPDFTEVQLAIARTMPPYEGREEIREVERLYLDSIEAASRFIYVENQYLSSHAIGQALARRLEEPDGPEIVVIAPEETGGWLEQHTMDVLRGRLLRDLRDADRYGRLRVYFARLSKDPHVALMVHAKLMIVDDRLLHVGSSNLSNRSMGLDSECDLAIDAIADAACARRIEKIRHRLLAEHLGVAPDKVAEAEEGQSSIIGAIESLRKGDRTLEPLSAELPSDVDQWVPDSQLLDPEKPIEPDSLLDYFVAPRDQRLWANNTLRAAVLVATAAGLAAAWRWTPLGDWLTLDGLASAGEWLRERPMTPLLVLFAYVAAGFAIVPVTLLYAATVMVFGPWIGMGYSLAGAELSALACFGAGHALGRDAVRRLAGSRVNRISRKLSERGILTMVTLRIVPIAPFSVINVVAGVSDIRFRDFAIGNFLGMIPGVVAIAFVADRALVSLSDPSTTTIVAALAVLVAAMAGLAAVRRWLRSRDSSS